MTSELRKTGISIVGDMPWGTHFCYFYETKQDLLDILIPYFKTGLEHKEFCLWVISNSELLTVQEATSALRNALPNLDRYVAERSIEVVGHEDWFLSGNTFDPHKVADRFKKKLDEALARGYVGMRINGSPAWLHDAGQKELRKFEAELDKLFPNERTIASCTYPLSSIGADEIFDVVRTHQFAIARRQGKWELVETPELIQAKAEIKSLNEKLEQRIAERSRELVAANEALKREIDQRKRLEEELRERAADLAEAQRVAKIGNWTFDLRTNKVTWSEELCRIFEIETQDFDGRYESFVSRIHTDDQLRVLRTNAQSRSEGSSFDIEYRIVTPNSQVRIIREVGYAAQDEAGNVVRFFGTAQDTQHKQAEEKLKATSEQLRVLSARLQAAREEEGTRIAREIHDELGSMLTSLKWDLEEMNSTLSTPMNHSQLVAVREKLQSLMKLTDMSLDALRRIASELRPSVLDDLGLVAAIQWQAQQFQARTGIVCDCDCTLQKVELTEEQSTAVFRILQEALTNVVRHAQATKVDIKANTENGYFILSVSDNGKGITESEKSERQSLGILGMRERAHLVGGEIEIKGVEGKGTAVIVRMPVLGQEKILKMTR